MIKRLGRSDLNAVQNMLNRQNRSTKSVENIESFLANPSNYFVAYVEEENIIGYALAYTLQRYDGRASMMYLHEIDVDETHRRKGIGKTLLLEMKRICHDEGFMKLFLITNKSNVPAVGLYESLSAEASSDDDIVYTFNS